MEDPPDSGLLLLTGKLRAQSEASCTKSYLIASRQRSHSTQFTPIIPRWKKIGESKMVEVNWPEWIVLRCEPKTDTDGNIVQREQREGRRLIGEEESFPEKSHKTD